MAREKPPKIKQISVPAGYKDREQAFIKHLLLEKYLDRLFRIVGYSADKLGVSEFAYIDCFAGPWQDDTDSLETTSIAISLRMMARCREDLAAKGKYLKFRALFVEKDATAFQRLQDYLSVRHVPGVTAEPMPGDFMDLRKDILAWCGNNSFAFFFVDPKGWKPVQIPVLRPLLERPRSEFLITFMYDFVNRTLPQAVFEKDMRDLLGTAPDLDGISPRQRETYIVRRYRDHLKRHRDCGMFGEARAAHACVSYPDKRRTKYHLVYVTCHPRGLIEFMSISEKLEPVQRYVQESVKQDRRVKRTGQGELFEADGLGTQAVPVTELSKIEAFWLSRLSYQPTVFDEAAFADVLEETDWFETDLQQALGRLIKSGKVVNLDAAGSRRTKHFLHFEKGERLQRVPEAP